MARVVKPCPNIRVNSTLRARRKFGADDALFTTGRGNLINRSHFNDKIWKPALLKAGLPEDATFHNLRHSFASTALAQGVPVSDVSKWPGHASITETVDTYGHLVPEADTTVRTAMDAAYDAVPEEPRADLVLTSGS